MPGWTFQPCAAGMGPGVCAVGPDGPLTCHAYNADDEASKMQALKDAAHEANKAIAAGAGNPALAQGAGE